MQPLTSDVSRAAAASDYTAWKEHYGIGYAATEEDAQRFTTFVDNRALVITHNAQYTRGEVSFSLELNEFAAMSNAEFKATHLGLGGGSPARSATDTYTPSAGAAPPASWDWRNTKNVVNPVKNQQSCGSCWAFSAVATMEGALNLKTGALHSLSEQELVDCVNGGANTCSVGGEMYQGVEYGISHGTMFEKDYPYKGTSGHKCKYDKSKNVHTFSGYTNVTSGDETASGLLGAAYEKPIISVGIDASGIFFQLYFGGVYDPLFCSSTNLDHGVAVIGYGTYHKNATAPGKDYWLVRNSWGAFWGLKGYVMMARNAKNKCGIATQACYAHY